MCIKTHICVFLSICFAFDCLFICTFYIILINKSQLNLFFMKKITLLFSLIVLIGLYTAKAGVVTTDLYKFEFNGVWTSTIPSAPSTTASGATTTGVSQFGVGSGGIAVSGNSAAFTGGGSGGRGSAVSNLNGATVLPTDKKVVLEFDWFINTASADAMAYNGLAISDASKNPIMVFAVEAWSASSSGIHFMNLTPSSLAATTYLLTAAAYSGTSDYKTDCVNAFSGSFIGADFTNNKTYHVKAKLDFATHKVDSLWITRSDDATKVYLSTDVAFLSTSANSADKISAVATRGKNQTNSANGGNSSLNMSVDNYSVYTWENAITTDVNVKYFDASDNSLIKTVVRNNQAAGGIYKATGADKTSFTQDGNYFVFQSISLDSVTIALDGSSHVDLVMKKYPAYTGVFNWTGSVDSVWNELKPNFTDGTNSLGYQTGNGVSFGASGINKNILINENFDLGAGNLSIDADGYTFGGSATLSGTGSLNVNLSGSQAVTMNISNNMSGVTQIAGGNVTLAKAGALGSAVNVTGASTIISKANLPSITFTSSAVINPVAATAIASISANAGIKVSVNSDLNSSATGVHAFNFPATGTLNGELELNATNTDVRFGMTSASATYLQNAKINLKGTAFFFINTNQGAASTVNIGTLSGENGTKLGWGGSSALDRTITWSVGGLNEDSEFAGTITNLGGYAGSGSYYTGNLTNFVKTGTGTLTMSGTSITHNGKIDVKGKGKLIVTGALGKSTTAFTVSDTSVLAASGDGKITAKTLLMGAADTLIISPSAKVVVYDNDSLTTKITNVVFEITTDTAGVLVLPKGLSITDSINLTVRVLQTPVALMKTYKLVDDSLKQLVKYRQINLPSHHYTFNQNTGELVFEITTELENVSKDLAVYPALVKNDINVNGNNIQAISIVSLSGQIMKEISNVSDKNKVNLSNLSDGAYLVSVRFTDGSNEVRKIVLNK